MPDPIPGQVPSEEVEKFTEQSERGEQAIKTNVEFWEKWGSDFGIEVDKEDIAKEIKAIPEVKGFDLAVYIPKGLTVQKIIELYHHTVRYHMPKGFGVLTQDAYTSCDLSTLQMPRDAQNESYAYAAHSSRIADADSLEQRRTAMEWNKTGEQFMTVLERMVASMQVGPLDAHPDTMMCPDCTVTARIIDDNDEMSGPPFDQGTIEKFVPTVDYDDGSEWWLKARQECEGGIRRVITKDTKAEVLDKYRQEAEASKNKE